MRIEKIQRCWWSHHEVFHENVITIVFQIWIKKFCCRLPEARKRSKNMSENAGGYYLLAYCIFLWYLACEIYSTGRGPHIWCSRIQYLHVWDRRGKNWPNLPLFWLPYSNINIFGSQSGPFLAAFILFSKCGANSNGNATSAPKQCSYKGRHP